MSRPLVSPLMLCVMLAIQLDLFTGREVAPSFESARDYDDAARRAGILADILAPCERCELRDFCGSDDCAQHLFDLDVDEHEEEEVEDEDEGLQLVYVD